MKNQELRIGFVGFGHMAQVLFEAADRAKIAPRSHIRFLRRDRSKMKENEQKFKITSTTLETLIRECDVIILAVRPQQASAVLDQMAEIGGLEGKWVISILSGVKIEAIQRSLGPDAEVLRVMPNIASAVNEGMSILSFGSNCSKEFKSFAQLYFGSMGQVAEVGEEHADIVCGLSGSGPGFVFRLIDAMARTGEKHGIPYRTSLKIASQTFVGAARLVAQGHLPEELIVQIAVPNGTTQAGFESMNKTEIDRHFQSAIEAAARRSEELGDTTLS